MLDIAKLLGGLFAGGDGINKFDQPVNPQNGSEDSFGGMRAMSPIGQQTPLMNIANPQTGYRQYENMRSSNPLSGIGEMMGGDGQTPPGMAPPDIAPPLKTPDEWKNNLIAGLQSGLQNVAQPKPGLGPPPPQMDMETLTQMMQRLQQQGGMSRGRY